MAVLNEEELIEQIPASKSEVVKLEVDVHARGVVRNPAMNFRCRFAP